MIHRTFQHIPGVGPWREKDLWARGIATWRDFPVPGAGIGISLKKDHAARAFIAEADNALRARDLARLAKLLPAREHWRLYPEFASDAVFFDIETDGNTYQRPTVVSLFSAAGPKVFIQGRNLEDLPAALAQHSLWVTFNGSCFDVPVLRNFFPELIEPKLHLDLRFLFRRLGKGGGLKQLEDELGIARPPHLKGANGWDAVLLWRAYQRTGDVEALRFLVEYNLYDAFQLRSLVDLGYNLAVDHLALDVPRRAVFDRGDVLYDVTRLLLDISPTDQDVAALERARQMAEAEGVFVLA